MGVFWRRGLELGRILGDEKDGIGMAENYFGCVIFLKTSMQYRPLGKTRITVSEIGFGSWGIGGRTKGATSYGTTDDDESKRALEAAFDAGITLYDTSDLYGYGHSEELIGGVFAGRREKVVIASKVGYVKHGGPHDFSPVRIRQCAEASLRRLRTDYIDLYQLHSPSLDELQRTAGAIEEIQKLKEEGKIRAIGISVKSPQDGFRAVTEFKAESVQVNFNMIDQRILDNGFLDFARDRGIGVIARTPLAFGFLSGTLTDVSFSSDDHRSSWPESQLRRWASAPSMFKFLNESSSWTPTQIALKFCLSFPAVSSVIPGILHPSEARENASASDLSQFAQEEIARAREVYHAHEFFDSTLKKSKGKT